MRRLLGRFLQSPRTGGPQTAGAQGRPTLRVRTMRKGIPAAQQPEGPPSRPLARPCDADERSAAQMRILPAAVSVRRALLTELAALSFNSFFTAP